MEKQKRILAVHDISCIGRCSLTVALPILSCGGVDTGILPTALLSTHTGDFKNYTYLDLTQEMEKILAHWDELNIRFSSIYSGFLGSYEQIDLVSRLMKHFAGKNCLCMVDPAMADHGKLYPTYTEKMAQDMKILCSQANIVVPNITEAAILLDLPYKESFSKDEIEMVLKNLAALGPEQIVLTGVGFKNDEIGAAVYESKTGQVNYLMGPKYTGAFHGTGDVFSSVLLSGLLNGQNLSAAAQLAVNFTYRSIEETLKNGHDRKYGVSFERVLPYLIEKLFPSLPE